MTDPNRDVAEFLGICWHEAIMIVSTTGGICSCGQHLEDNWARAEHLKENKNPDFSTDEGAVRLLRELIKRPDWIKLRWHIGVGEERRGYNVYEVIILDLITTRGALRDKVIGWTVFKKWKEGRG